MDPSANASDDDSAARQLLLESHASRPLRSFKTTAERSASLLNAARADRRTTIAAPITSSPVTRDSGKLAFSSPGGIAQGKGRTGKLKRPVYAKGDLTRMAVKETGRRSNVYDIPLSPEKRVPNKVHVKAIPKPPVSSKQHQKKRQLASSPPGLPSSPPQPVQNGTPRTGKQNAQLVSSPPESGRRRSGRLAGDEIDLSLVDWEKPPEQQASPKVLVKRKAEAALTETERPKKSSKRTSKKSNREEDRQIDNTNERRTRSQAKQVHPEIRTEPTDHRKKGSNDNPVPQARKKGRKLKVTEIQAASADAPKGTSRSTRATRAIPAHEPNDEHGWNAHEEANREDDSDETDHKEDIVQNSRASRLTDLDRVFAYLDLGDREGSCRTEDGKKMKGACEQACRNLNVVDLTPEEVGEHATIICQYISEARILEDADAQKEFKKDAFAYLFFSLATFMETTYDWFRDRYGDPLDSLPALRVLVPLMKATLQFKDTITAWEGQVPQRFKGDRIVRGVEQNFIAPLRKVEEGHRRSLDRLQRAEEENRIRQELRARHREEAEEAKRKEEQEARRKDWEAVWQNLHAVRLDCEPSLDPARRKHLFRPRKRAADERDANGIKFERVPGFHERKEPYKPKVLPVDLDDWTDEQMATLVNGLQKFAGRQVFEKMFKKYCRPGGPLRDFSVMEITAQARDFHLRVVGTHTGAGWDVPEWIKQIPLLPLEDLVFG